MLSLLHVLAILAFSRIHSSNSLAIFTQNGNHTIPLTRLYERVVADTNLTFANQVFGIKEHQKNNNNELFVSNNFNKTEKGSGCESFHHFFNILRIPAGLGGMSDILGAFQGLVQCHSSMCEYESYKLGLHYGEMRSGMKCNGNFECGRGGYIRMHTAGMGELQYFRQTYTNPTGNDGNFVPIYSGMTCKEEASGGYKAYWDNIDYTQVSDIATTLSMLTACWGAGKGGAGNLNIIVPPSVFALCHAYHFRRNSFALCDHGDINNGFTGGVRLDGNNLVKKVRVRAYEFMWAMGRFRSWEHAEATICNTIEFHEGCKQTNDLFYDFRQAFSRKHDYLGCWP